MFTNSKLCCQAKKGDKRFVIRTACRGNCGKAFQAAKVDGFVKSLENFCGTPYAEFVAHLMLRFNGAPHTISCGYNLQFRLFTRPSKLSWRRRSVRPHESKTISEQLPQKLAEAKSAVLQEAGIRSPVSNRIATGTGTDAIAIVSGRGPQTLRFCGKHVRFGEVLGLLVTDALTSSIDRYLAQAAGANRGRAEEPTDVTLRAAPGCRR